MHAKGWGLFLSPFPLPPFILNGLLPIPPAPNSVASPLRSSRVTHCHPASRLWRQASNLSFTHCSVSGESSSTPGSTPTVAATDTFPRRHPGGGARRPPAATRPTKAAQKGVSVPEAFGGGGVSAETPPQRPAHSAKERPALGGRGRPGPAPAPPTRLRASPRSATPPPAPLGGRPVAPSPRSRAPGDAPDPTSPRSCAFPRARAAPAPAGPRGRSPRSSSPGSCLRSPRRLGLLPLSPAPPPRAGSASCPARGRRRLLREACESPLPCAERASPAWPGTPRAPPRRRAPRAREPGAPGAWDPAEPLPSPRGSAGMQAAL